MRTWISIYGSLKTKQQFCNAERSEYGCARDKDRDKHNKIAQIEYLA